MHANSGTKRIEVSVPNLKWHWVAWFIVVLHQLSNEPSMLSCSVPSPDSLLGIEVWIFHRHTGQKNGHVL